jgi:O-antigen chain-terminating methyltransferase
MGACGEGADKTVTTADKVRNILHEIESAGQKTASQVADILLNYSGYEEQPKEYIRESENTSQGKDVFQFDMPELKKWKERNNSLYQVKYYRNIFSSRKALAGVVIFIKRAIRKVLRFLIEPVVQEQNEFNGSVTASVNALYNNAVVTQSFINHSLMMSEKWSEIESALNHKLELYSAELAKVNVSLHHLSNRLGEFENYYKELALRFDQANLFMEKQKQANSLLEERLNHFETFMETQKEIDRLIDEKLNRFDAFTERLDQTDLFIEKQRQANPILEERLNRFDVFVETQQEIDRLIDEKLKHFDVFTEKFVQATFLEERLDHIKSAYKNEISGLVYDIEQSELNILRFIGNQASINAQMENSERAALSGEADIPSHLRRIVSEDGNSRGNTGSIYQGIDYFVFENHFRGARWHVKKTLEQYIPYFSGKEPVVDLGCGRGEFLELLKQNQIEAVGVDLYPEFVDYCNMKGLSALADDALAYVSNMPNDSVGGLFASQLAEHLETNQLVSLCGQAYRKLRPDGCFILETPNPTSLAIYTNWFYVDPTHIKPVHPKTLEYFLRQAGFKDVETLFTEQSKPDYRLPLLDGEHIHNLAQFNDGINAVSDLLFGSQDYAIIARK